MFLINGEKEQSKFGLLFIERLLVESKLLKVLRNGETTQKNNN